MSSHPKHALGAHDSLARQWMSSVPRVVCCDEATHLDPHGYNPARSLDENGDIDTSVRDPEARVFGSCRRYEGRALH